MIEDFFFQDEGHVKIIAASVGISKLRWTCSKTGEATEAKKIMEDGRFDHLPIVPVKGPIKEYFQTDKPNDFENIKKHNIEYADVIPVETNIRDVIDKFANSGRTFFFLSYQRNISGLITLGNLNCKQVQVYIFSLMCELERELADFLNLNLSKDEIQDWVKGKAKEDKTEGLKKNLMDFLNSKTVVSDADVFQWIMDKNNDLTNKYNQILKKQNELKDLDLENQLTEHLYLIDFFNIFQDEKLFKKLGYDQKGWKKLKGGINELRNRIAHPTKSLLDKKQTIKELQERLNRIEDLIFRLATERKRRDSMR